MDEKWFFALVARTNGKCLPFLGIEPEAHWVQHKAHIHKNMLLVSTAFRPFGNDIEKGGVAYKVSFVRAGRMMPASRTTFKRVYKLGKKGGWHYPPIPANILRIKGELYFQAMDITGSFEGTEKNPKYSLLRFFDEIEIPALETLAKQIAQETGKRVVFRYQMDGAGPHRDTKLLKFLDEEFDKRGWMLKFQPSNSPLTNVKDMSIFPALSKHVSELQGVAKGSYALQGEELYRLSLEAWNKLPLKTIASAYAGHHQVANAIAQCEGGDVFARTKGGTHFGIRKAFVPCFPDPEVSGDAEENESSNCSEPCSVELMTSYDGDGNIAEAIKLKYPKPDTAMYQSEMHELLSEQELNMLEKYLPPNSDRADVMRRAIIAKRTAPNNANAGEVLQG